MLSKKTKTKKAAERDVEYDRFTKSLKNMKSSGTFYTYMCTRE